MLMALKLVFRFHIYRLCDRSAFQRKVVYVNKAIEKSTVLHAFVQL